MEEWRSSGRAVVLACNASAAEVTTFLRWTSELRDGWQLKNWTQQNGRKTAEASRAGLPSLCLESSIAELRGRCASPSRTATATPPSRSSRCALRGSAPCSRGNSVGRGAQCVSCRWCHGDRDCSLSGRGVLRSIRIEELHSAGNCIPQVQVSAKPPEWDSDMHACARVARHEAGLRVEVSEPTPEKNPEEQNALSTEELLELTAITTELTERDSLMAKAANEIRAIPMPKSREDSEPKSVRVWREFTRTYFPEPQYEKGWMEEMMTAKPRLVEHLKDHFEKCHTTVLNDSFDGYRTQTLRYYS